MKPKPLKPERVRILEKPFSWIPFRFVSEGYFENLTDKAKLLYLFLCIVADSRGQSYYSLPRINTHFQLTTEQIISAQRELIQKDMITYDGRLYQVLSLPRKSNPNTPLEPRNTTSNAQPENIGDILKRLNIG